MAVVLASASTVVSVGADALEMDATARQSSPDELVRLLREFVASLAPTS